MDETSAAEELPALYRALLERIAQIDAAGHRTVGYRVRVQATQIYSRAWDDRARRGLEDLLRHTADKPAVQETVRRAVRRSAPLA